MTPAPDLPPNAEYVPDDEAPDAFTLDDQPYQVMDPLDAETYAQLKDGIRESGILDPVHFVPGPNGEKHLIDGHHRILAFREIDRDGGEVDWENVPHVCHAIHDTDECERRRVCERMAWELNMQQRHLDDGDKKDAIERRLQQLDSEGRRKTDRAVAETLGVSASWVREVRHRLEGSGNIRTTAEITTDTDGRRTDEDRAVKRAAVRDALREDPSRSNRDIAREFDVSHPFVGGVREDMGTPEVPERFADRSISDECQIYVDETRRRDVWMEKTVEPAGWWVRLRDRDFYEERELVGRGLNAGWCVAARQTETKHDAAETAEQFLKNPQRYATRRARQLREEGYEFEHTNLRADAEAEEGEA
jgi:hypothetical protein